MGAALTRLATSAAWRVRRLRRALWSRQDVVFWVGDAEDAPWYPDPEKLAQIGRAGGLEARPASPEDLELFRQYHAQNGNPLGPRRIRQLRRRWERGDECYIAVDREGAIVSSMWVTYQDSYVDLIGGVYPVGPEEVMHLDVDTRTDRRGSMGFVSCVCAALAAEVKRGRRRVISFSTPELFERFRRFHWWAGLGAMKPRHVVRCTRVAGLRFRRFVQVGEDWAPEGASTPTAAPR